MSTQLDIGGYKIEFDREATAACYAQIAVPGPEACGCAQCRNWAAARDHVVPADVRQFLAALGIPLRGEIEVWEVPGESQPHFYGGWYFFVGRIVAGMERHEFDCGTILLSFASRGSFAVPAFEGKQVCELHFTTEVGEYLSQEEYAALPKPK